jgi:hypothetical protein
MPDFFTNPDAMQNYLTSSSIPEPQVRPYAQDLAFKANWIERLKRTASAARSSTT